MKEKSFAKEQELFVAALEEFTQKPYEEASLNTILKNAGVSKGVFYYHFADKQALYLYLLQKATKEKWAFITQQSAAGTATAATLFEQFRVQARFGLQFAQQHPQYHKLGRMLAKEAGNPIYEIAKQQLQPGGEEQLAKLVDAALAKGELRPGYTRAFLIQLFSFLFSGFDEVFGADAAADLNQLMANLDQYVEFMRRGLGGEARPQ